MPDVVIPYAPRRQFRAFHQRDKRWSVLVVHRRAGKTVAGINDLIRGAMTCPHKAPRFAYVAPTYAQAKDVAWSYLNEFTAPIPGRVAQVSELHVTMPGDRRVRLYGSDNYDRMRGIYLDGCIIDEPADMDPAAWYDVIRPALSDRGGWCVWIGTPKGKDAFYRLYSKALADPEWYTMLLPASQSGILPADELASAKRAMSANTGAYEREYECSFEAPIAGAIYGDIIAGMRTNGQIKDFLHDASFPVWAAWDIGWSDETVIWFFQVVGREVHWLWCTRQRHRTAAEMMKLVRDSEIPIAGHFLPWDSRATAASVGVSYRDELAKAGGMNIKVMPPTREIWAGINVTRDILKRSYIHATRCAEGIDSLVLYRTKEVTSGGVISREPIHDHASHCFTGETEVLTRHGACRIDMLPESGEILTPWGYKKYRNPRVTRTNSRLVEVTFTDGLKVKSTPDHLFLTVNGWKSASELTQGIAIQSAWMMDHRFTPALHIESTMDHHISAIVTVEKDFIGQFGKEHLERFPMDATFTTRTKTRLTTPFLILNACLLEITSAWSGMKDSSLVKSGHLAKMPGIKQQSGTRAMKAWRGIEKTLKKQSRGKDGSVFHWLAKCALSPSWRCLEKGRGRKDSAGQIVRPLHIESVQQLSEKSDVWCLTVPEAECFSLANGAVVHNCADAMRYACEAMALGMVKTPHARLDKIVPEYPDGALVDIDTVRDRARMRRPQSAASGIAL